MLKAAKIIIAALVLVTGGIIYYRLTQPFPFPPPTKSDRVGPTQPEATASDIANRIMEQVARYHDDNGQFPDADDFWDDISDYIENPLRNSINGSDEVVLMTGDVDARSVGWVYDDVTGAVYPGAVFNSARATIKPSTRPGD